MPPKPLVFVPGLPASVILEQATGKELFPSPLTLLNPQARAELIARLSGPDDPDADDGVIAGDPIDSLIKGLKSSFIDFSGSLKLADSLYGLLEGFGYPPITPPFEGRFRPLGWDWRRPVGQGQVLASVKRAITDLHTATGEPVVLLCHSTGGLIVRSLLEGSPEIVDLLERVIAIGVPWVGTLQSFPFLAGHQGFGPLSSSQTQHVLGHSWAAFDLLPPDPAQTDMTDAEGDLNFFTKGQQQASPLVETAWIPAGPAGHALGLRAARSDAHLGERERSLSLGTRKLEVVNFVGWGGQTLTGCEMDAQGNLSFATSDEGDGTIPRRSAAWLSGGEGEDLLRARRPLFGHPDHPRAQLPLVEPTGPRPPRGLAGRPEPAALYLRRGRWRRRDQPGPPGPRPGRRPGCGGQGSARRLRPGFRPHAAQQPPISDPGYRPRRHPREPREHQSESRWRFLPLRGADPLAGGRRGAKRPASGVIGAEAGLGVRAAGRGPAAPQLTTQPLLRAH